MIPITAGNLPVCLLAVYYAKRMSLNTVIFTVDLRFQFIAILCKVVIHVSGDL